MEQKLQHMRMGETHPTEFGSNLHGRDQSPLQMPTEVISDNQQTPLKIDDDTSLDYKMSQQL